MTKTPPPPPSPWTLRKLAVLAGWISVLSAVPVAANRWWNHPGVLLGIVGFYVVAALVLRSRLLIGMIAGTCLGFLTGAETIHGGTGGQQELTRLGFSIAGMVIGVVIGFGWDQPVPAKKKKR